MEKIEITTKVPVREQIIKAMKDKKVVHIKDFCWFYLTDWGNPRNPQTGEPLALPSPSRAVFISEGFNSECKNDHQEFFLAQNLPTQEIEIPELADYQKTRIPYFLREPERKLVFYYILRERIKDYPNFVKVATLTLDKELRREISDFPPFIEEVYDWKDLQTPDDEDNPHPRLQNLKLVGNKI